MASRSAPPSAGTPASPLHAPTRRRAWRIAGIVAAVAVLALVACEALGWPFLIRPVENGLTRVLMREVRLAGTDATATAAGQDATIRFLGGLTVKVPMLRIAPPEWSRKPFFLEAQNAQLRLAYAAMWRASRGKPLDVKLLQADDLVLHAERRADGVASWQFGDPAKRKAEAAREPRLPVVRKLFLRKGELHLVDALLKADLSATVALAEGGPGQQGLQAQARGRYKGVPVSASLRAKGAMPLIAPENEADPTPVELDLKAAQATLHFTGVVVDALHLTGLRGAYRASGASLSDIGDPMGVTLPTTGRFELGGTVAHVGEVWHVVADHATVGRSRLTAAMSFDGGGRVPTLSGRLDGSMFVLADLVPSLGGAAVAEPARPSARLLPERAFDLPSLRAMNANVLLAFDRVELGRAFAMPLEPMRAHLTVQAGKLLVGELMARTANGSLSGSVALDGTRELARWNAKLRWSGVELERWLAQGRGDTQVPYIRGKLSGSVDLKGQGRSTAEILASLDGAVKASLRNGQISHLAIEAAGLDVAQALGVMASGDRLLPVECALADMRAKDGVLRPRVLVIDTADSTLWADGSVSLAQETLDLKVLVSPKDFSPMSLRTPLRVRGSFRAPEFALDKGPLARKLGASVLLGLLNPLAALVPLVDPGETAREAPPGCQSLLDRARRASGAASAPAR